MENNFKIDDDIFQSALLEFIESLSEINLDPETFPSIIVREIPIIGDDMLIRKH